jgi:hypothetical protein
MAAGEHVCKNAHITVCPRRVCRCAAIRQALGRRSFYPLVTGTKTQAPLNVPHALARAAREWPQDPPAGILGTASGRWWVKNGRLSGQQRCHLLKLRRRLPRAPCSESILIGNKRSEHPNFPFVRVGLTVRAAYRGLCRIAAVQQTSSLLRSRRGFGEQRRPNCALMSSI